MGCHTWFSVPYKTDKKEIINLAQQRLDKDKYISHGHRIMYQWAIDNEVQDPVCELAIYATDCNREDDWVLYKDIKSYSLEKYNKENGTDILEYTEAADKLNLESYSDEPRIGGYPDKIIRSYDEMVEFMKDGHTDEEGRHFDFYYDEKRINGVMAGIQKFFSNHPGGIITFG